MGRFLLINVHFYLWSKVGLCAFSSLIYNVYCHAVDVLYSYADDIILLAPSIMELEKLLHACERELEWLDMSINYRN